MRPDLPESRIISVLTELDAVESAFIDASSIIVCDKAGFLDFLAGTCLLRSIPEVIRETGLPDLPVRIEPSSAQARQSTDDLLLAAVTRSGSVLISEDRKLLLRAEARGVRYYNAVMMLNLLLRRGIVSKVRYDALYNALAGATRYSAHVKAYSGVIYQAILKGL